MPCPKLTYLKPGFTLLGVALALAIMGVMAFGVAYLQSASQTEVSNAVQTTQAYYSAHALSEYALRQIKALGTSGSIPTRNFLGLSPTITRSGGRVSVHIQSSSTGVSHAVSFPDPVPVTQASCLRLDTSGAMINGSLKRVIGLQIYRDSGCWIALTITQMVVTFVPSSTYRLRQIAINGVQVYNNGTGLLSGSTFTLSPASTLNTSSYIPIDRLQFNNMSSGETFTLSFIMSDGSVAAFPSFTL